MRPLTAMPQNREPLRLSDDASGGLVWKGLLPLGSLASVLLHGAAVALIAAWFMREPLEAPIGYAAVELVLYSAPLGGGSPETRARIAPATSENTHSAFLPEEQKVVPAHMQDLSKLALSAGLAKRESHEPLSPETDTGKAVLAAIPNPAERETVAAQTQSPPPLPRKRPVRHRVTTEKAAASAQELPRKSFGDEDAASADARPGEQTASRAYDKEMDIGSQAGQGLGTGSSLAVPVTGNSLPTYPYSARLRGIEGRVLLEVEVGVDGRAGRVRVVESSGHRQLDHAAREGIGRWQFRPAKINGRARASTVQVPVRFELTER